MDGFSAVKRADENQCSKTMKMNSGQQPPETQRPRGILLKILNILVGAFFAHFGGRHDT
jgi:hypothetical protein